MESSLLQNEVRRWKIMAIIAVTLCVGVVGGVLFGYATAQGGGVQKVQLDTSNCSVETATFSSMLPSRTGIGGGIMLNQLQYSQQGVLVYTVCN